MAGFPNSNSIVVFEEAIPAPTLFPLAQFQISPDLFSPIAISLGCYMDKEVGGGVCTRKVFTLVLSRSCLGVASVMSRWADNRLYTSKLFAHAQQKKSPVRGASFGSMKRPAAMKRPAPKLPLSQPQNLKG